MTIASIQTDRAASAKKERSGDHLRIISNQTPRQDDHKDMMGGEDDNARFANVVLPHLGDAYALARWITGNRADAEDVVQDACLRAFRAIRSFANGSARAWVLTIVRNTAYTWISKNRPAALVVVDDLEAVETAQAIPGDPNASTPETAVIAQADAARCADRSSWGRCPAED